MVGIGKGAGNDIPRGIPAEAVFVHEQTHHFGNGHHGVGIVELYHVVHREVFKIGSMIPLELVNKILKAGRSKEILLFEPERLAGRPGIVRIQDTGNVFGVVLPFNRPQIMHVVEKLQIESVFRARFPQAEAVHGSGIKPDYGDIVGGGGNFLGVLDPVRGMTIGSLVGHRRAAEAYGNGKIRAFYFPGIAMFEPVVRIFYLIPVLNMLFKHTVLVPYTVSVPRIIEGRERIEETGRKTPETAVSETGIRFFFSYVHVIEIEFFEYFPNRIHYAKIDAVVSESPAHEKFRRKIIHLADGMAVIFLARCHPVGLDKVHESS